MNGEADGSGEDSLTGAPPPGARRESKSEPTPRESDSSPRPEPLVSSTLLPLPDAKQRASTVTFRSRDLLSRQRVLATRVIPS
jgi:hypothetical protein